MPDPATDLLFVYGTLRDDEIQLRLFGESLTGREALLRGWEVMLDPDYGYYFIRPAPGGVVHGLVLDFPARHWPAADRWEGVPYYIREQLTVELADGTALAACAYTRRDAEGTPTDNRLIAARDKAQILRQLDEQQTAIPPRQQT